MNDLRTSFFIAYKSILKGSRSTFLLMIFILTLTFLNMMFISGVLSGFNKSEVDALINFFSSDITISPQELPQPKQYVPNQSEIKLKVESIPGVAATARHYLLAGSLSFDKTKNGTLKSVSGPVIGVDPTYEPKVLSFNSLLIGGSTLSEGDTDSIVLSSALAGGYDVPAPNDLGGVKVGDKIKITFSNGIIRTYKVKGIYNDLMGVYETFITAKEAESVLGVYDSASQVLVKLANSGTAANVQAKIKSMYPNLKVQTYNDLLVSFTSFLNALDLISLIVSIISVAVAAFTIFVLIYINALNKKRQIGILKAIGIKQNIIVTSYIMQSIFYTICAVAVSLFFTFVVFQPMLYNHPVPIIKDIMNMILVYSFDKVFWSVVSFLIAGFLAGYIPSRMVVKRNILEAIWGR